MIETGKECYVNKIFSVRTEFFCGFCIQFVLKLEVQFFFRKSKLSN